MKIIPNLFIKIVNIKKNKYKQKSISQTDLSGYYQKNFIGKHQELNSWFMNNNKKRMILIITIFTNILVPIILLFLLFLSNQKLDPKKENFLINY